MNIENTLPDWVKEFSGAVTVADTNGVIIYMNDLAANTWKDRGGLDLIGKNLSECHKGASMEKIAEIISSKTVNAYTIEKKGLKKLIYQAPWIVNNITCGIVELSLIIPFDMPHFIRT